MLIFYILSIAKIILVPILNLFNLIDGPHQVDSPQAHHCDANKEDEVHAWQARSPHLVEALRDMEEEPVEVPMEEPMDEEAKEEPMFEEPLEIEDSDE